jgi:hypothetical protein
MQVDDCQYDKHAPSAIQGQRLKPKKYISGWQGELN